VIQAARALALLRGRQYVLTQDVRDLARDVLRHRLVLSYEALSEGIDSDAILDRVLDAVPESAAAPLPAQGHYAA
jgi:MoxR-like ATPase